MNYGEVEPMYLAQTWHRGQGSGLISKCHPRRANTCTQEGEKCHISHSSPLDRRAKLLVNDHNNGIVDSCFLADFAGSGDDPLECFGVHIESGQGKHEKRRSLMQENLHSSASSQLSHSQL